MRLEVRVVQSQLGLVKNGVGLVYNRERGSKFGLRLIKIRSSKTLRGVKRFRALSPARLNVLGRSLTDLCFCLSSDSSVLLTNLRKNAPRQHNLPCRHPVDGRRADYLLNVCTSPKT